MTIGFIGCGNMAQPIIRSVIANGVYNNESVYVYDMDTDKLDTFCKQNKINALNSETEIASICDTVFLCIKPQGFAELLSKIADTIITNNPFVVSIAAGKEIAFIEKYLTDKVRIGRVFPNLNASVCQSASAYCTNNICSQDDIELLDKIVTSFGTAIKYPEVMFSQFGVLGGCSPAYTFMYINSLAKAAENNGMERELALSTAIQAVLGSAMYMQNSGISPEILIDRVCSKGGTTIEGIRTLKEFDFEKTVSAAYEASLKRDKELSLSN